MRGIGRQGRTAFHAIGIVAAALMAVACAVALTSRDAASQELYNDRELLVLTRPPAEPLIEVAQDLGYTLTSSIPLDDLAEVLVVLRVPDGRTIPEAIADIEAAVPGVTAGAHHLYRLQDGSGEDSGFVFANAMLDWPDSGCRAAQPIGLIDAGVAAGQGGPRDGRIVRQDFVPSGTAPGTDHGTLMAELLIGPGRLTGTRLFNANVVDPARDQGDAAGVAAILQAVDWLKASDVRLVNISLAGPRNKLLDRALGAAAADEMIFVAAAGNDGPASPPMYPAAFPFVLAVTAVDRDGQIYPKAVRGGHIDLAGPGVDIVVSAAGRTRILSGTSAATPFVTAAIAADPTLLGRTVDEIRSLVATRTVDLGAEGIDPIFGQGLLPAPSPCRP